VKSPVVSVVIPAYNADTWLAEAIQSVLDQSWQDFELIVVNDGSTDRTTEVVRGFKNRRISCISQENRGLSSARNTGIRGARGEFIALLDADDKFKPEKLTRQLAKFDADPEIGIVTCGYDLIDDRGKWLQREMPWLSAPLIDLKTLLFWNPLLPSTLLIRTHWFKTAGLFDGSLRRYEDWELPVRFAIAGCRMGWVHEVLVDYRRHETNMSTAGDLVPVATNDALEFITRFFREGELDEEIQALESKVLANLYLDGAARAYGAALGTHGSEWLEQAVRRNPELTCGDPPGWVVAICGHALGPLINRPEDFIRCASANLPVRSEFEGWTFRRLMGHFRASQAFRLLQAGENTQARLSAVRAMLRDFRLLSNRGMLSIALRSHS